MHYGHQNVIQQWATTHNHNRSVMDHTVNIHNKHMKYNEAQMGYGASEGAFYLSDIHVRVM